MVVCLEMHVKYQLNMPCDLSFHKRRLMIEINFFLIKAFFDKIILSLRMHPKRITDYNI